MFLAALNANLFANRNTNKIRKPAPMNDSLLGYTLRMPSISTIKYGENFRNYAEILSSAFSDCLFSYFLLLQYFGLSTKVQNGIKLYSRLIEKLWCVSVREQMVNSEPYIILIIGVCWLFLTTVFYRPLSVWKVTYL